MELNYKGRTFEIVQLSDLNGEELYGIVAILEVTYVYFLENGKVKEVGFEEWQRAYENDEDLPFQDYRFINYYCGVDDDIETIVENAHNFIDDYDKKEGKVAQLLRGLENKVKSFPKVKGISEMLEEDESIEEDLFDIVETIKGE